jgi:teichuronic acid biosynthesis glycosyltransferase TuaG
MPDNPLVSVITPLYNAEFFISETIESVKNQELQDWELLIIDDCSTDKGPDIVESYAREDRRIKLISLPENGGAGICRNAGIEASRGRYLAFLDSDDVWLPGKLMRQLEFMKRFAAPFSFTHYRQIGEDGTRTDRIIECPVRLTYKKQLKTNFVGCSTAVYDSRFYGKRYFPEIRKRQDYGLWLDLLKDGTVGLGVQEALTEYRVRKSGLSGRKLELIRHNWLLYRKVLGFSGIRSVYYLGWNIGIKLLGRR